MVYWIVVGNILSSGEKSQDLLASIFPMK
jgi:hypothetical protein